MPPTPFSSIAALGKGGGEESAFQWNSVVHLVLDMVVPLWYERGWGVKLGDRFYTHLIRADNFFLLSA